MTNIKITIPDGDIKKQIKDVKLMIQVIETMELLTHRVGETDMKPLREALKELEAKDNE